MTLGANRGSRLRCLRLNTDQLAAVPAPDGKPRVILRVRLPNRKLSAEIATKSLRKAQAAIREAGVDAIALVLRSCLVEGDVIAEAALSAQPKAAKQAYAQDENVGSG
jgi:hypothetical protein